MSRAPALAVGPGRGDVSAALLGLMIVCFLGDALFSVEPLRLAARGLVLAYVVLEWPRLPRNARIMVGIAAAMTVAVATTAAGALPAMAQALDRGAFFATFFANQFFLRQAAQNSPLVHRCGSVFVNQRPGRRYLLLTVGGYLFGIILNLGVLSLLGVMIGKRNTLAAAGGSEAVRAARERRMVSALLRGFSITPLGSPLSIALAVMLTAMPGVRWQAILPLGLGIGVLVLATGWVHDRLTAPRRLAPLVPTVTPERDLRPLAGVAGLVLSVLALAIAIEQLHHVPMSRAILVAIPTVGLGWLAVQYRRAGPAGAARLVGRRLRGQARVVFPGYRSEIAILGSAGFIGTLFSSLLPPEAVAAAMAANPLPTALIPAAAVLLVIVPATVGINPIVTVTILASAMPALPDLPLPPELLAVALMTGWSLSINASPLTASAMLLAEIVNRPAGQVTLGWNGGFTLAAAVIACTALGLLASLA